MGFKLSEVFFSLTHGRLHPTFKARRALKKILSNVVSKDDLARTLEQTDLGQLEICLKDTGGRFKSADLGGMSSLGQYVLVKPFRNRYLINRVLMPFIKYQEQSILHLQQRIQRIGGEVSPDFQDIGGKLQTASSNSLASSGASSVSYQLNRASKLANGKYKSSIDHWQKCIRHDEDDVNFAKVMIDIMEWEIANFFNVELPALFDDIDALAEDDLQKEIEGLCPLLQENCDQKLKAARMMSGKAEFSKPNFSHRFLERQIRSMFGGYGYNYHSMIASDIARHRQKPKGGEISSLAAYLGGSLDVYLKDMKHQQQAENNTNRLSIL